MVRRSHTRSCWSQRINRRAAPSATMRRRRSGTSAEVGGPADGVDVAGCGSALGRVGDVWSCQQNHPAPGRVTVRDGDRRPVLPLDPCQVDGRRPTVMAGAPYGVGRVATDSRPAPRSRFCAWSLSRAVPPKATVLKRETAAIPIPIPTPRPPKATTSSPPQTTRPQEVAPLDGRSPARGAARRGGWPAVTALRDAREGGHRRGQAPVRVLSLRVM